MKEIQVLLADDHTLLREALVDRFQREVDIRVVGSVSSAEEAMRQANAIVPDVILMDIDMPGLSCFDAASRILKHHPEIRLVFLSAHTNDRYIEEALRVGGLGYLTKSEPPEMVVHAIRIVASGKVYFSDEILSRLEIEGRRVRLVDGGGSRTSMLTPREVEVLRYLARGLSKREVAEIMHVTPKTVDKHTENLMRKVDIHDRVKLARFAIREGLAEL